MGSGRRRSFLWVMAVPLLVCACGTASSSVVRSARPRRDGYAQTLDSASSACRQNPAYCIAPAGEEVVLPVQPRPPTPPPEQEAARRPKDKAEEQTREKTGELTWQEFNKRCNEEFTLCLHTATQGKHGPLFNHSHCFTCRDVCMRNRGVWPAEVDGTPCL